MDSVKIPIAKPYIDDADREVVASVLKSDFLSGGPYLEKFEDKFAKYIKAPFSCAVSSGTAGLHLAVKVLGIGHGDEVITSPFSFVASSNCLLYEGAKPVFIDIEETTFNIDPEKIEAAISKKTKAILVVHIFGQTAQMDKILEIAKRYNLKIIEDACESLGSTYEGKTAGTFGDAGVFAFYPNKQMTTGEGGMIVSDNEKLIQLCKSLRNQGRTQGDKWLESEMLGHNYRLDEMSAALGFSQLGKIDFLIAERRKVADIYSRELAGIDRILTPKVGENRTHTWFVYVVRAADNKRDVIAKKLAQRGIQTRNYLPAIHLQPFMRKMFGYREGDFPISEKVSSQTLALPIFVGLGAKDIKYICDEIRKA